MGTELQFPKAVPFKLLKSAMCPGSKAQHLAPHTALEVKLIRQLSSSLSLWNIVCYRHCYCYYYY